MTGVSIEVALELWASTLREAKARLRPLFTQARVAASAELFLEGLLGAERRKTGWCAPRLRAIPDHGASRPSRAGAGGRRTHCATWCASGWGRRCAIRMRCW